MTYTLESSPIIYASISKDCKTILYCTSNNKIVEIPVVKPIQLTSITQTSHIEKMVMSHNGYYLVICDDDGNIKLYNTKEMKLL